MFTLQQLRHPSSHRDEDKGASSRGKECSNRWFRIRLLFLHENFIGIAFQINMSVKLKGKLLMKCLFTDMSRNSLHWLSSASFYRLPPFECKTTCQRIHRQGTLHPRDGCGCISGWRHGWESDMKGLNNNIDSGVNTLLACVRGEPALPWASPGIFSKLHNLLGLKDFPC